jgi:CRISPR-associated protein Cas1
MIHQLLNTLFVQAPGAYVRLEGDTLRVEVEKECRLRVPIQHLGGVVLFGDAMMSSGAMGRCAADGREVTFLDFSGRFRCRVTGPARGNVLLRAAQHESARAPAKALEIARRMVGAKIRNSRIVLLRGARDAKEEEQRRRLTEAAAGLAEGLAASRVAQSLDDLRGVEGESAARYFAAFGQLLTVETTDFAFTVRTRRPPRDRVNALLSFLYAVLANDCAAAAEGVGLDPQIGFLHAMRSGRPALALDLMEEFRAGFADRLAVTLINRRQLRPEHFDTREKAGESVLLNEEGRKAVITAYQERKAEETHHRLLKSDPPLGLVPHLQARLLARHLRGEIEHYQPFLFR